MIAWVLKAEILIIMPFAIPLTILFTDVEVINQELNCLKSILTWNVRKRCIKVQEFPNNCQLYIVLFCYVAINRRTFVSFQVHFVTCRSFMHSKHVIDNDRPTMSTNNSLAGISTGHMSVPQTHRKPNKSPTTKQDQIMLALLRTNSPSRSRTIHQSGSFRRSPSSLALQTLEMGSP